MSEQSYPVAPEGIRVLKNGAGYSETEKRIVHGPGTYSPDTSPITPDNAADMVKLRQQRAIEAAAQAIASDSENVYAGWQKIIAAQVLLSKEIKAGRASTEAAKFVGRAADLLSDPRQPSSNNQVNIQVNMTEDVLRRILSDTGGPVIDVE